MPPGFDVCLQQGLQGEQQCLCRVCWADCAGQTVLGLAQARCPNAALRGLHAWFVLEGDPGAVVLADVHSPAAQALAALPAPPARLVFGASPPAAAQPVASTSGSSQPQQPAGSALKKRQGRQGWGSRALQLAVAGVKVLAAVEVAGFLLSKAPLPRGLKRAEGWGPSSGVTDGSSMGTSSEAADLILEYLEGGAELDGLADFSPVQLGRALDKIQTEDLEELGVAGGKQQLAQLRGTVRAAAQEAQQDLAKRGGGAGPGSAGKAAGGKA